MRYVELTLRPGEEGFHPADRMLVDSADVERVAIHHINQLDDGTIVFLYELRGDMAAAEDIFETSPEILAYSISDDDEELHAYIHLDANDTLATLFRLPQQYSIVVDTPIECLPDGSIRVTSMADKQTITEALGEIPDTVDVELETMGEYSPEKRQLFSLLTERQREILTIAIDAGYYDVPRDATYEDVARELDLAPVTVGEHLRKIESKILREIVPG